MKKIIIAVSLLFFSLGIFAQTEYRLIGTNLYDFSYLNQTRNGGLYRLTGRISQVTSNFIQIEIPDGVSYEYHPTPGSLDSATPGQMLQALAAFQMSSQQRMSEGQYFSLSPEMRRLFSRVPKTNTVLLINYWFIPHANSVDITDPSASVDCLAVPISQSVWDFGIPFKGDTNQFKFIYHVLPDRITRIERPLSEIEKLNIISSRASNGVAYYQFLYGKHFLTLSNTLDGYMWIRKAANQDYTSAVQFLTNHP